MKMRPKPCMDNCLQALVSDSTAAEVVQAGVFRHHIGVTRLQTNDSGGLHVTPDFRQHGLGLAVAEHAWIWSKKTHTHTHTNTHRHTHTYTHMYIYIYIYIHTYIYIYIYQIAHPQLVMLKTVRSMCLGTGPANFGGQLHLRNWRELVALSC